MSKSTIRNRFVAVMTTVFLIAATNVAISFTDAGTIQKSLNPAAPASPRPKSLNPAAPASPRPKSLNPAAPASPRP